MNKTEAQSVAEVWKYWTGFTSDLRRDENRSWYVQSHDGHIFQFGWEMVNEVLEQSQRGLLD